MELHNFFALAKCAWLCSIIYLSFSQVVEYPVNAAYDLCDPETETSNPKTIYLPDPGSSTIIYLNFSHTGRKYTDSCFLVVKTCESCSINVTSAWSFSLPPCSIIKYSDDRCQSECTFVRLYDQDYLDDTMETVSQSSDIQGYHTESRKLAIQLCVDTIYSFSLGLRTTAVEKLREITQVSLSSNSDFFQSPFFPDPYVKNSEYYTFRLKALYPGQRIVVSFDDWLLSPSSLIEFEGATSVTKVKGSSERPFVISSDQIMTVTFFTGPTVSGSSTYLGFRANVTFYNNVQFLPKVPADSTNIISGGDEGGLIRLTTLDGDAKDIIWIVPKMKEYDKVYLKVTKNERTGSSEFIQPDYSLIVCDGLTSVGPVMLRVSSNDLSPKETALHSEVGFYIRQIGKYSNGAWFTLVYAMYIENCEGFKGYFKCDNGLCISDSLKCDGTAHCEDLSDELPKLCDYSTTNAGSYPINIGIIVPLVVSVFLIIVICILIIFIRRCRRINAANSRRSQHGRDRRRPRHNRDVQMSVTLSSGDCPPTYEEVLLTSPGNYLNMAFTWSHHGSMMTLPPSYEEAVSPLPPQQNGSTIVITALANDSMNHSDSPTGPQHQNPPALLSTLSSSLDPQADVSSSSSEDPADHYDQLNISSSSDSSIGNYGFINSNPNVVKHRKDNNSVRRNYSERQSDPKNGNNAQVQIVLQTTGSAKINAQMPGKFTPHSSPDKDELQIHNVNTDNIDSSQTSTSAYVNNQNNNRGISSDQFHDTGNSEVFDNNQDYSGAVGRNFSGGISSSQPRYQKKNKDQNTYKKQDARFSSLDNHRHDEYRKETSNSVRSQSCFDLSLNEAVEFSYVGGKRMTDGDKRFSYAGAGDASLNRANHDNIYPERRLFREKRLENLNKLSSRSHDNLRGDSRKRLSSEPENYSRNYSDLSCQGGEADMGRVNKSELVRAHSHLSLLAPVPEDTLTERDKSYHCPDPVIERRQRLTDESFQTPHILQDSPKNLLRSFPNVSKHSSFTPSDESTQGRISKNEHNSDKNKSQNHNRVPGHHPRSTSNEKYTLESDIPNSWETTSTDRAHNSLGNTSHHSNLSSALKSSHHPSVNRRKETESTFMQSLQYTTENNTRRVSSPTKPEPLKRTQIHAPQSHQDESSGARPKDPSQFQRPTPAPRNSLKKKRSNRNPPTRPSDTHQVTDPTSSLTRTFDRNVKPGDSSHDYASAQQNSLMRRSNVVYQTQILPDGRCRSDLQEVRGQARTDPEKPGSGESHIKIQTTVSDVFV